MGKDLGLSIKKEETDDKTQVKYWAGQGTSFLTKAMIGCGAFDTEYHLVLCIWHRLSCNMKAFILLFCLPTALHYILNWELVWINWRYPCVFRNPFTASQPEKTSLEWSSIYSNQEDWRWLVIVEESKRT